MDQVDNQNPPATPPTPDQPPTVDPRRRLRELLSVPESVRTDPQWDEIIELEVQLAPGNRIGAETPRGNDRSQGQRGGGGGGQGGGGGGGGNPGGGSGSNWKRGPGTRKHSKPGGRKPPGAAGAA